MYTSIRLCAVALSLTVSTAVVAQNTNTTDQLAAPIASGSVSANLRASDALENHGPHYMNDQIASSAVAGAVDWTWSFHNSNGNELPIVINKGDDDRFIKLADVPGLQTGNTYNVQVKPVMATGEIIEFGDVAQVAIVTTAPVEDDDLEFELRGDFTAPTDLKVTPKEVTGQRMVITFGSWVTDLRPTKIGIRDQRGGTILKTEATVGPGDEYQVDLRNVDNGVYTVITQNNNNRRDVSFKINRERGQQETADEPTRREGLEVSPERVTGREVKITFGDWIAEAQMTTLQVRDTENGVKHEQRVNVGPGEGMILDVSDWDTGMYTIRVKNKNNSRQARFKIDRRSGERDFEAPQALLVSPRVLTGNEVKVTLGEWIGDQRSTVFIVKTMEGREIMRTEAMAEAGTAVPLRLDDLENGRYVLQAVNLNGREEAKFQVNRERGFEAPGQDLHVFPNPIQERDMQVKMGSWVDSGKYTGLRIYDDNGNVKASQTSRVAPGEIVRMDVSMLRNGEYNLVVVNGRERRNTRISIRR